MWSSYVVAQMLRDAGQVGWQGMSGTQGPWDTAEETHFWLERDGWVLDPTADQFPDRFAEPFLARGPHPMRKIYERVKAVDTCDIETRQSILAAYVEISRA